MTNRFSELTQDIQDRIREIAYLMWESAGRQHGMAMEYWLSAEQEVLSTLQAAAHRMMPEAEVKAKTAEESAPAKAARSAVDSPASEAAPAPAASLAASTAATATKPAARRTTRAKAKV
jgi:hypothetical protein